MTNKFRAYVKEFWRTLDVKEIYFSKDGIEVLCDWIKYPISIDWKNNVLQQNTGLVDSEGNDIFDWDILDFGSFDTAFVYYYKWAFRAEGYKDSKTNSIKLELLKRFLDKNKAKIIGRYFEWKI